MSSAQRMAEHRERRKREGMSMATIWLTKEDTEKLGRFMAERKIESKQEAIQAALRTTFEKETAN
ncbi:hypothetical protein EV128_1252 [Rhizobium azibense]|nr:hypothetical protein EV128_1252 [Rhizobium azibense]